MRNRAIHIVENWHEADRRPPLGYGSISVTALTLRALQLYPLEGRKQEFRKRIERARDWLLTAAPGIVNLLGQGPKQRRATE